MSEPGRDHWFEGLLAGYHDRLVWFVRGLVSDDQQARDIAQETFVAAWRARRQGSAPFGSAADEDGSRRWLYRVAYNRAISFLRQRRRSGWESLELLDDEELSYTEPVAFEDQVAEADLLRRALTRLSPDDAAAVLLHAVHGFTAPEIAQILDVSLAAATKRVWRAKERLRSSYFSLLQSPRSPQTPVQGQA
jgi:RNA polymerase sigma-70 factor (ECF subfamily)